MKLALYLDTSLCGFGFILKDLDGKKSILHREEDYSSNASSFKLSSCLQKALKEIKASESDIKLVVVSKGPGSFTGIRIGLSWAKGFCLASQERKLVAISSLESLAVHLGKIHQLDSLSVLLANTKTTGFVATYSKGESGKLFFLDDKSELEEMGSLFVDSFYGKIKEEFTGHVLSKAQMASLSLEAMAQSFTFSGSLEDLKSDLGCEPLYLRRSSVEERFA